MNNDPYVNSPYWLEMVMYLIELIKSDVSLDGVNRALLNKEVLIGRGFRDYKRVLNKLIDDGVIKIYDQKLYLGSIKDAPWINLGLEKGVEKIWEIADVIEPNRNWEQKYDNSRLVEIGLRGEEEVMNFLYKNIDEKYHKKIKHVSKTNDRAGYDIFSPSLANHENSLLLEIKTTVKPSDNFMFYLSRHEFDVAMLRENWILVFVRIINDQPKIIGHLKINQINHLFPLDNETVSWECLKIVVSEAKIKVGLP